MKAGDSFTPMIETATPIDTSSTFKIRHRTVRSPPPEPPLRTLPEAR
jgi:hypothetical protein